MAGVLTAAGRYPGAGRQHALIRERARDVGGEVVGGVGERDVVHQTVIGGLQSGWKVAVTLIV